jgi:hypothetical protein
LSDFIQRAARGDRGLERHQSVGVLGVRDFVPGLEQQPVLALAAAAVVLDLDEVPAALHPSAVEREVQVALLVAGFDRVLGSGVQKPRSHSMTEPPPYCPLGMVPSKSP